MADRVGDQLLEALSLETRLGERLAQAEDRLLERLAEALDLPDVVVRRLANASLGLDSLAPMIAAGVETRIRAAVETFLSSPEGTSLLIATIEIAHERSVLLLRDEMDQLPNVVVEEGEVRLNLVPLMAEVLRSVVNAGLDFVGIEREIPPFDSSEDATAAVERLASVVNQELPPDFGQVRLAIGGVPRACPGPRPCLRHRALAARHRRARGRGARHLAGADDVPRAWSGSAPPPRWPRSSGWIAVQFISAQVVDAAATPEGRLAIGEIVTSIVSGLGGIALTLAVLGIACRGRRRRRRSAERPGTGGCRRLGVDAATGHASSPAAGAAAARREPRADRRLRHDYSRAQAARRSRQRRSRAGEAAEPTKRHGADRRPSGGEATPDATASADAPTKKRRRPPATGA